MIRLKKNPDAKEENYGSMFARIAIVAVFISMLVFQSFANELSTTKEKEKEGVAVATQMSQQTKTISGIVLDTDNMPVI